MMKLVFATHNKNKWREVQSMLPEGIQIITPELSGYGLHLSEKRRATLALVVNDLFPGGGDLQQAEFWSGLRPMTPDSTPLIGKTPLENLFLNTGHGTLGWTMSLGSAKLAADIVCGKETEIRSDDLGLSRYTKV